MPISLLNLMLPEQVSKFWDVVKYAIEQSLPPIAGENPDRMNRILASILSYKTQCWASYVRDEDVRTFNGIVLTRIVTDDISGLKSLLIYCLYGYNNVSEDSWKTGFKTLVKWAMSKGCSSIIGYTDNPRAIEIVKKFGGEAKQTFVSIPLR
jgi:hypothetical protein